VKGAPAERGTQPRLLPGFVTVTSLPVVRGHEIACDSQHQQSALGPARRSKINSFYPPLTAVCTAYPTPPLPPLSHPPVELAGLRPRGNLHLDWWVDLSAICLGTLLQVVVAEVHI
jgi:hypothetical protein